MRQILILRYLTSVGESPDLMVHMYDQNVLGLILKFIDVDAANKDPRLSFEALKFLGALLCDTKFAVDFLYGQGLHRLIEVPRPSIAAVVRIFLIYLFRTELILFEYYIFFFLLKGVAMCLYHIACSQDAMELVCLLPELVLQELVRYALWLLEYSHESGRCYAAIIFCASFRFHVILDLFDAQDGLSLLFSKISALSILAPNVDLRDDLLYDEEPRHVLGTFKHCKYLHYLIINWVTF